MDNKLALEKSFTKRLVEDFSYSEAYADKLKNELMKDMPEELFENVDQWSNRRPLTDVEVYGVSILDLYKKWGGENFLLAINILSTYANDPSHHYGHLELRRL
ncbi:glucuronate isomerase [Anaerococcus sp. Marseille-P9784]|uniref:glucuronate isomerase n=1 Tax=Anaerococcus sp. Marseille-P9784 TaxID=2614127 RepID=UPI00124A1843|nr:glucuronate isomerase [Anaerococcus sp. Marseille-P9784]